MAPSGVSRGRRLYNTGAQRSQTACFSLSDLLEGEGKLLSI